MKLTLYTFFILFIFILPTSAQTVKSVRDGYWSSPYTWSTGKVPVKGDNVIISSSDTVIVDISNSNGGAQCSTLTIDGALTFDPNNYYDPGTISVFNNLTIAPDGKIIPARDTTFLFTSEIYAITVYGDFINNGEFQTSLSNSKNSMKIMLTMYGSSNSLISNIGTTTYIYWINAYNKTSISGSFSCNNFDLYGPLDNSGGQLKILNNGGIYFDTAASFAVTPEFGKYISITYNNHKTKTTGVELPDTVNELRFADSLILNKSITVLHQLAFNGTLFTGNDTLTLGDSAFTLNDFNNFVIGNMARVFRSKDSLVYLVGVRSMPQARTLAIKLNNLPAAGAKITVTASDSSLNINPLPSDVSAYEKYYFWNIKADPSYSRNIDADVSLSFNSDKYSITGNLDYINNYLAAAILKGNQNTGQWNTVNNNIGISELDGMTSVTSKVNSFGDFTMGQLYELPNGNFETWQYGWPYGWKERIEAYSTGISQSDSAHSGSYAAEGTVVTGYNNAIVAPDMKFSIPFLKYPQVLKGFYQFYPVNGDKYYINVTFYKDSNVVGQGSFIDSSEVASYKEFDIGISLLTQTPGDTAGSSSIDSLSIETGIKPGNLNSYHLGSRFLLDDLSFGKITDVISSRNNIPSKFTLYQNYPNPFNPSTNITFSIPNQSHVVLEISDILGRKVATLINSYLAPGVHRIVWNADNYSSGVYFYQLRDKSNNRIITKKMLLLK